MQLFIQIPIWSLFLVLLVVVFCDPANPQPTRCVALCLRSETEDSCQRCRLRVPMRFGKRADNNGRLRIPMRFGKRFDNVEESQAFAFVAPSMMANRRSMDEETNPLNQPTVLDGPENWFFRVLKDPTLATTYDNRRSDYDQEQDDQ